MLNKIPLLVIGLPATSKSLSLSILMSHLRGPQSTHPFFRNFPNVQPFFLQCSSSTTAHAISECFLEAVRTHAPLNLQSQFESRAGEKNFISVVILDEIGLAELNPQLPLKVLHRLLDDGNVAFVGISNWILDASKMNRAVCSSIFIFKIFREIFLAESSEYLNIKQMMICPRFVYSDHFLTPKIWKHLHFR